jgi:GNAT superfamily N-acetyltransferase
VTDAYVRAATLDDASVIAAIHAASWQHVYRGVLPDAYLDSLSPDDRLPMWARILATVDSPMHVGVAEVDGHVVGFYSIGPSNEGDPGDVQMLYTIYLLPALERQGIGRALMTDAEDQMRARGARGGVLRVITANSGTRQFYERLGWTQEPGSVHMEDAWGQEVETIRYRKALSPCTPGSRL